MRRIIASHPRSSQASSRKMACPGKSNLIPDSYPTTDDGSLTIDFPGEVTEWPFTSAGGGARNGRSGATAPAGARPAKGGRPPQRAPRAPEATTWNSCGTWKVSSTKLLYTARRGDRVAEGVRLEIVCAPKGHRGFDSRPLRPPTPERFGGQPTLKYARTEYDAEYAPDAGQFKLGLVYITPRASCKPGPLRIPASRETSTRGLSISEPAP